MRGLIFGNSHVAAVRLGQRLWKGEAIDFYAIPGGSGPNVRIKNQRIVPHNARAKVHTQIEGAIEYGLDLTPYDYIVFCSFGLAAVRKQQSFKHFLRQVSLARLQEKDAQGCLPVSEEMFKESLRFSLSKAPCFSALKSIRKLFDGSILCANTPLPALSMFEEDHPLLQIYGSSTANFVAWYCTQQISLTRDLISAIDPNIQLLEPLDPAWLSAGSTPARFATHDPWHMNEEYGRLFLEQVDSTFQIAEPILKTEGKA